jgi:hypothetical protein
MIRKLSIVAMGIGVASIVIGAVFISQGVVKNNYLTTELRQEKITLGIPSDEVANGEVVDNAKEAQAAADIMQEHRDEIAPNYTALLDGKHFDPTNTTELEYAQAMNIENSLELVVLGFGVTQIVIVSGVFMILSGIAFNGIGVALYRSVNKQ